MFLEKYTIIGILSVSTIRKTYINDCYQETINEISNHVLHKMILLSIDETTDTEERESCKRDN